MFQPARSRKKGSILVLAIFMLAVILLLAGVFLAQAVQNMIMVTAESVRTKTYWIAKAGISRHIHDLREDYFGRQFEMNKDIEYGSDEMFKGKYTLGAVTLIGQGYHRTLICSVGEYGKAITDTGEEESKYKYAMIAEVDMNSATDYLLFKEGLFRMQTYGGSGGATYAGPIHVNGDVYMGKGTSGDIKVIKSKEDYGPAVEASGTFYVENYVLPLGSGDCVLGEGDLVKPFNSTTFNYTQYSEKFFLAQAGINKWMQGSFNVASNTYQGSAVPYNPDLYPTTVSHDAPDGTTYEYDLIQDSSISKYLKIKIPKTTDITFNTYKPYVDPEWHIKNGEDWTNLSGKKTKITVEMRNKGIDDGAQKCFYARWVTPTDKIGFAALNNSIALPIDRDPNYINRIYLKPTDLTVSTIDGNGIYGWPYVGYREITNGRKMNSFTIDHSNKKIVFSNEVEFDGIYFDSVVAGGKWRGTRGKYGAWLTSTSIGSGGSMYAYGDAAYRGTMVPGGEQVYVNGALWTRVASLTGQASTAQVYVVDYATQKITFGDDVNGAAPSGGAYGGGYGTMIYQVDMASPIEVWLGPAVEAYKLDLDKIDETNCPRDPKYPDDKTKYGVIYSEVPLAIKGTPKVPVTIVCEGDVMVGPINASHLKDGADLDIYNECHHFFSDDSDTACPVGIVTKKICWADFTYAPVWGNKAKIAANGWNDYPANTAGKDLKMNKVSLFYPFSLPVLPTAFFGDIPNSDRNLMVRFGMNGFGGVGGCGDQGIDHSYNASGNNVTFIGSLYACEDKDLQDRCMGIYDASHNWWRKPIVRSYPFSDINYSYASSFRFQEPEKKNYTGPAPHLPKTINVFSYRVARVDKSEEFFVRLTDALAKKEPYTKELTTAINDLLTSLEGEPTQ